jgi:hypothetical protein
MNLLAIKEIFKIKNNTKYYTFKKAEHEMVLLKKLEDNKIFYNNKIYDQDFFYYHKLDGFMEQIYEVRDEYINEHLNAMFFKIPRVHKTVRQTLRSIKDGVTKGVKTTIRWTGKSIKSIFNRTKKAKVEPNFYFVNFIVYDPNNCDEITNLVKEQYDVLVKAYKYEFEYKSLIDLLNPKRKLKKNSDKDPMIKEFFNDWFYILGWKSLKPVHPTFHRPFIFWNYDDDAYDESVRRTRPLEREDLLFRNTYENPFNAGTRFKLDWIEVKYDEQKKFDEFDINCKTNSYYARYIAYNEIYNKDYPEEKKFKTDLIHDFTEEEIKENYENMIDKEKLALDKFNFVMLNEKRKTLVLKFFEELEVIEVSKEKLIYDFYWNHEEDSDMWLVKEIEDIIYDILSDPRNLLMMPLLDAYFEVFRSKGFANEDESFFAPRWGETNTHKKLMKHLMYFDLSYERQYLFAEKMWLIDDYMDIDDLEFDEHYEDEHYALGLALILFIWLFILNFYIFLYWFSDLSIPFNSPSILTKYSELLRSFVYDVGEEETRQLMCPEIYYGLELKRPRSRIKTKRILLPFKFYEPNYYSYTKKRASNMMPFGILEKLCIDLDEKDYGLNKLDRKLRLHGSTHLIWKLRIPLIEYPYPWTKEDPSPITRFINFVGGMVDALYNFLFDNETFRNFLTKIAPHVQNLYINYMRPLSRSFRKFERTSINYLKEVKNDIINYLKEVKQSIIDYFKKPTN